MSPRTLKPHIQTALRRSARVRKVESLQAEADQGIAQESTTGMEQSRPYHSLSKPQELPSEIWLLVFPHLIISERPFLIGRCQEERRKIHGSPRDIFTFHSNTRFKVRRNEKRNRPKQPAISRVCRMFREETLPLWYSENQFWLIHNEFEPENEPPSPHRGFDTWLSQTPREMFSFMRHVSLCGYGCWPNRMMITIDLKNRQVVNVRHYSTYGGELPIYSPDLIQSIKQVLNSKSDEDGLAALKAVLASQDRLFHISREYEISPPGMMRIEPASGWEYDW